MMMQGTSGRTSLRLQEYLVLDRDLRVSKLLEQGCEDLRWGRRYLHPSKCPAAGRCSEQKEEVQAQPKQLEAR